MKIFMLVSRVPWPLEKGDKLRAFHQLQELSKKHEVYLCCLSDGKIHPDALKQLQKITQQVEIIQLNKILIAWQLFRALWSKSPYQVHYFFQRRTRKKILKAIDSFHPDHIYCQLVRTAEYVKNLHQYKKTIDYMDSLSAGLRRRVDTASYWMKPFVREEASRLTVYENLIFDYFENHTIISEQDKQLIYHEHRQKIAVIPNGVDYHFFSSTPSEKKYELVFSGNMSYPPNIDCALRLAHEILPLIRETHPQVKLLIAGANPATQIQQLASDNIIVTGWMDDIRDAYNESSIFIAPMRIGSGLQNKLLEAMSMELPCITTQLAAKPIGAEEGAEILVAESNEAIANHVCSLLADAELRSRIGANARKFISKNFDWAATVKLLEKEFSN